MNFLIAYLCLINLAAVIMTIKDKRASVKGNWRVPEKTLLIISAFGGSVGMYATMRLIHHKTLHAKFMVGIPVIFALQCAAVFLVLKYIFRVF